LVNRLVPKVAYTQGIVWC